MAVCVALQDFNNFVDFADFADFADCADYAAFADDADLLIAQFADFVVTFPIVARCC